MADQVQFRGGTEAENDAFTGVNKEITVDTTNNTLRVHDGATQGGFSVVGEAQLKNVDTLADLKALTADDFTQVFLRGRGSAGDGAHGVCVWRAGDQSTNVTNDPQEVVWIPPDSDATGASGAWERLVEGPVSVRWGGVTADGTADDSDAFRGVQDYVGNNGGGLITVPFVSAGYRVGDGVAGDTGVVVQDDTHWQGQANVKLIHDAILTGVGNYLFHVNDVDDVTIEGFFVDGEGESRQAVHLEGIINRVTVRDCHFTNCENQALVFGDTDTNAANVGIDDLVLENIRIDGTVGATSGGINIFPRANEADNTPVAKNLRVRGLYLDVSEGNTDVTTHAAQGLKVSNTENSTFDDIRCIGGSVTGASFLNGVRFLNIGKVTVSKANRGLQLDGNANAASPDAPDFIEHINIGQLSYHLDGATATTNEWGLVLSNSMNEISIDQFDIEGALVFQAQDTGVVQKNISIGRGVIRDHSVIVDDGGNAVTADITGVYVRDLAVIDANNNTAVDLRDSNWKISDSRFERIYTERAKINALRTDGDNNHFGYVEARDGDPNNTGGSEVVLDRGNDNVYNHLALTGNSNNMEAWLQKSAGNGITILGVSGSPTNAEGFIFTNQENSDVPVGDVVVTSKIFDLSGGSDSEPLYVADVDTYILGISFSYWEASSADAGVNIRVRVNASDILTYTSETSMARFDKTNYINTSGTRSFSSRKITKGQVLDILCNGGKTGDGEVVVRVSMVRARN